MPVMNFQETAYHVAGNPPVFDPESEIEHAVQIEKWKAWSAAALLFKRTNARLREETEQEKPKPDGRKTRKS